LEFIQKLTSAWEWLKWIRLVLGRVFAKRIQKGVVLTLIW
jgi:hypothetical protein